MVMVMVIRYLIQPQHCDLYNRSHIVQGCNKKEKKIISLPNPYFFMVQKGIPTCWHGLPLSIVQMSI